MKRAIVTGGVRGIGLAAARLFLKNGYDVVCAYSRDEASARAAEKAGLRVFRADVSEEEDVKALFSYSGAVDVLVNNAGVSLIKQIQDTTLGEWNRVFSVNTTGAYLCTRYALCSMLPKKSGSIVNVSSVWGVVGGSCEVAYSSSKAALVGFTRALAKELGPSGIRVNCVAPGVVDTRMNDCFSAEEKRALAEEIPLLRTGTPEEIAQAIFFLAENGYVTGQVLGADGGFGL